VGDAAARHYDFDASADEVPVNGDGHQLSQIDDD
jgi:hypothetical protein